MGMWIPMVVYADHNFTEVPIMYLRFFQKITDSNPQHRGEVIETILLWWETRRRGRLRTGLWLTGGDWCTSHVGWSPMHKGFTFYLAFYGDYGKLITTFFTVSIRLGLHSATQ